MSSPEAIDWVVMKIALKLYEIDIADGDIYIKKATSKRVDRIFEELKGLISEVENERIEKKFSTIYKKLVNHCVAVQPTTCALYLLMLWLKPNERGFRFLNPTLTKFWKRNSKYVEHILDLASQTECLAKHDEQNYEFVEYLVDLADRNGAKPR